MTGVSANTREDSEAAEITWECAATRLHAPHTWQMSATGWCYCRGLETTPIYDALLNSESGVDG